jgi:hypothetical protein
VSSDCRQQPAAAIGEGYEQRALKHGFDGTRHHLRRDGLDVARIGIRSEFGFYLLDKRPDIL